MKRVLLMSAFLIVNCMAMEEDLVAQLMQEVAAHRQEFADWVQEAQNDANQRFKLLNDKIAKLRSKLSAIEKLLQKNPPSAGFSFVPPQTQVTLWAMVGLVCAYYAYNYLSCSCSMNS